MEALKLSKLQREVLTGVLLGDGSLVANTHKTKYSLRILQSEQHKDYVFHLYEIFKNFTLSAPKQYIFTDKRSPGKIYSRWSFNTIAHPAFRFYAHQFYSDKIRKVPKLIHRWLSPRAIAYWYMDHQAQKWKGKSLGVRFCTDRYSLSEVTSLIYILKKKYNLKCSIEKKGGKPRIYISSHSYHTLKNLIFFFIIPCMHYKFPAIFVDSK